jgi:hypothetical protein
MAALVTHPPLAELNLSLLAREGLVTFYEACGFEELGSVERPGGEPEEMRYLVYSREG